MLLILFYKRTISNPTNLNLKTKESIVYHMHRKIDLTEEEIEEKQVYSIILQGFLQTLNLLL